MGDIGRYAGQALGVVGTILMFTPLWKIGAAMMIAGGILSYMTAPRVGDLGQGQQLGTGGHLLTHRSLTEPVPIVYGEVRVGGNIVHMETSGANNNTLHLVVTFSEGPAQGIPTIWFDDKTAAEIPAGGGVHIEVQLGTADQEPLPSLVALFPGWADAMRHTAYAYIRIEHNQDIWPGLPQITGLVQGRLLTDVRTGVTAWSQNPALVIYDLLTNQRYGLGFAAGLMDAQSFRDAANRCDAEGLTFSGIIRSRAAAKDVINQALLSMRGFVTHVDGVYKLRQYYYDAPVMAITQYHILQGTARIELPGLPETPNRIVAHWIDPVQRYTPAQFQFADPAAVVLDGRERDLEVHLLGTTSYDQAARLSLYYLERARRNKVYTFSTTSRGVPLEPGDVISVTQPLYGWTDQSCRVQEIAGGPDHTVALSVIEEAPELYDQVFDIPAHGHHAVIREVVHGVPPDVGTVTLTEVHTQTPTQTVTQLKIEYVRPTEPGWNYAEIFAAVEGGMWMHAGDSNGIFWLPVEVGKAYGVLVRGVSITGVKRPLEDVLLWSRLITGGALAIGQILGLEAVVGGEIVTLRWTALPARDLRGYEIRLGETWAGAAMVGFSTANTITLSGIQSGLIRLWVAGQALAGTYGEAASVDVDVFAAAVPEAIAGRIVRRDPVTGRAQIADGVDPADIATVRQVGTRLGGADVAVTGLAENDMLLVVAGQWQNVPYSAVSTPTANSLMLRDAAGRAQVAAPSAAADIARLDTVTAHNAAATGVHGVGGSTVESVAGAQTKVNAHANLTNNPHAVSAAQVGAETPAGAQDKVDTHNAVTNPHSAVSTPTANMLMLRDSAGRVQAADGVVADDLVTRRQWTTGNWPLLSAIDGTPAAPAYSFTSDPDTGIRRGGGNDLRLVTGGVDRATFDSLGRVGIRTTAPQEELTLGADSDFAIEMAPPTGVTATAVSGGTLPAGTYFYRVVVGDGSGWTTGSAEASCTVDGVSTNACRISWVYPPGADHARIYGRSSPQNQFWTIWSGQSYVDTGTAGAAGTVPTVTTIYASRIRGVGTSRITGELDIRGNGTGTQRLLNVGNTFAGPSFTGQVVVRNDGALVGGHVPINVILAQDANSEQENSLVFARTVNNLGILSNNTFVGQLLFRGSDNTKLINTAAILVRIDGTPGLDSMPGRIEFRTTPAGAATLATRMTIRHNGNVGIGITPEHQLQLFLDSAAKPGTNTWTIVSDERLKQGIVLADLDRCYEIVKALPLKRFTWRDDAYTHEQVRDRSKLGWISQDVAAVFPKATEKKRFDGVPFEDGLEEFEEQDYVVQMQERSHSEIKMIDGQATQIKTVMQEEQKVMLFDELPVFDEAGKQVFDENGAPLIHKVPRMVTRTRPKMTTPAIEDALTMNSDQIIAALYGAVQKLMVEVEDLRKRLDSAEGRIEMNRRVELRKSFA